MTFEMKLQEEREEAAIEATIKVGRRHNFSEDLIVKELMEEFDLTREEAEEYVNDKE